MEVREKKTTQKFVHFTVKPAITLFVVVDQNTILKHLY